jgi:hypothetical protein
MDTLAVLGALAATEGSSSMAILTAPQLPPGNLSWTAREISSADQAFAGSDQAPLNSLMMASMCVVAWKEATFVSSDQEEEESPPKNPSKDDNTEREE